MRRSLRASLLSYSIMSSWLKQVCAAGSRSCGPYALWIWKRCGPPMPCSEDQTHLSRLRNLWTLTNPPHSIQKEAQKQHTPAQPPTTACLKTKGFMQGLPVSWSRQRTCRALKPSRGTFEVPVTNCTSSARSSLSSSRTTCSEYSEFNEPACQVAPNEQRACTQTCRKSTDCT